MTFLETKKNVKKDRYNSNELIKLEAVTINPFPIWYFKNPISCCE